MKIQSANFNRKNEAGSATVDLIALLAIMMILVTANTKSLFILHREVKLLEQQQVKRLNDTRTNSVTTPSPDSK